MNRNYPMGQLVVLSLRHLLHSGSTFNINYQHIM